MSYSFIDGIEFIPFEEIKQTPFFNYELQRDAGIGIAKQSFADKKNNYVMCFGYPGTGKSIFTKQLIIELGILGYKPNLLVVSCNTLLSKASGVSAVIDDLNKTIRAVERKRPLIYVLDEFDAITQDRLLSIRRENVNEFTQWFMDTFGNDFSSQIKNEGGLVVFAFTNDLLNIDPAVRRRFGTLFHFDLPKDEVLLEILKFNKIPNPDETLSIFKESLFDSKVDGASFMRSCIKTASEIIAGKLKPVDSARALIANIGAHIITTEQEMEYKKRLGVYINVANETMRYWRDKK